MHADLQHINYFSQRDSELELISSQDGHLKRREMGSCEAWAKSLRRIFGSSQDSARLRQLTLRWLDTCRDELDLRKASHLRPMDILLKRTLPGCSQEESAEFTRILQGILHRQGPRCLAVKGGAGQYSVPLSELQASNVRANLPDDYSYFAVDLDGVSTMTELWKRCVLRMTVTYCSDVTWGYVMAGNWDWNRAIEWREKVQEEAESQGFTKLRQECEERIQAQLKQWSYSRLCEHAMISQDTTWSQRAAWFLKAQRVEGPISADALPWYLNRENRVLWWRIPSAIRTFLAEGDGYPLTALTADKFVELHQAQVFDELSMDELQQFLERWLPCCGKKAAQVLRVVDFNPLPVGILASVWKYLDTRFCFEFLRRSDPEALRDSAFFNDLPAEMQEIHRHVTVKIGEEKSYTFSLGLLMHHMPTVRTAFTNPCFSVENCDFRDLTPAGWKVFSRLLRFSENPIAGSLEARVDALIFSKQRSVEGFAQRLADSVRSEVKSDGTFTEGGTLLLWVP